MKDLNRFLSLCLSQEAFFLKAFHLVEQCFVKSVLNFINLNLVDIFFSEFDFLEFRFLFAFSAFAILFSKFNFRKI